MPGKTIGELAASITEHTLKIEAYIQSQNLPSPSFATSTPLKHSFPPHIKASQDAVLEATDELRAHVLGPVAYLTYQRQQFMMALKALQTFNIAKSFPSDSTASFSDIARFCSLPESDIRRILRHAMTYYVFAEPMPGVVAHTAASKALAEVPSLSQMVNFALGELWPASSRMVEAMEKWPGSEEPNETGFNIANQTDAMFYGEIKKHPARAKRAADAMSFMQSGPNRSIHHLIENYDWGNAAEGQLVDIGGSRGSVALEIARRLPAIKCVVQDLPEVIAGAEVPDDLKGTGRVTFMAHDFFTEQPVKGADIYHLRWILHNWPEKYCIKILRNLIPALKKGARILVSETCLPSYGEWSRHEERPRRDFDIGMKAFHNGRERDSEDWQQLFQATHSGLSFNGVKRISGYDLSIIEAVWEG